MARIPGYAGPMEHDVFPPHRLIARGLGLRRGGLVLAEELSLSVEAGGALELRGPNGAGKTTLLRTLAGFARPAAGAVRLACGEATLEAEERARRTHWLGHAPGLRREESVGEHLTLLADWWGVTRRRCEPALARVGLAGLAPRLGRMLSTGERRRLGLARLLLDPRPVWLLDEPAGGMDEQGRTLVMDLVEEHRRRGGLAVVATHEPVLLMDADQLTLELVA